MVGLVLGLAAVLALLGYALFYEGAVMGSSAQTTFKDALLGGLSLG